MTKILKNEVARLEKRLERLKKNMLSPVTRPRIIAGAVAMEEARRNREFAIILLAAMDRGQDREVDLQTMIPFVEEITTKWCLEDRVSLTTTS